LSPQPILTSGMYLTKGIDAIATITELRSNTSELLEYARENDQGILIQKNNQPYAVLISWELYDRLLASEESQKAGPQPEGKKKRK
jgi:prevent-host-death family protein